MDMKTPKKFKRHTSPAGHTHGRDENGPRTRTMQVVCPELCIDQPMSYSTGGMKAALAQIIERIDADAKHPIALGRRYTFELRGRGAGAPPLKVHVSGSFTSRYDFEFEGRTEQ